MMTSLGRLSAQAPAPSPPTAPSMPPSMPSAPGSIHMRPPFHFPFRQGGPFGFGPFTQRLVYLDDYDYGYYQQPRWLVPVLVGLVAVLALRGAR